MIVSKAEREFVEVKIDELRRLLAPKGQKLMGDGSKESVDSSFTSGLPGGALPAGRSVFNILPPKERKVMKVGVRLDYMSSGEIMQALRGALDELGWDSYSCMVRTDRDILSDKRQIILVLDNGVELRGQHGLDASEIVFTIPEPPKTDKERGEG